MLLLNFLFTSSQFSLTDSNPNLASPAKKADAHVPLTHTLKQEPFALYNLFQLQYRIHLGLSVQNVKGISPVSSLYQEANLLIHCLQLQTARARARVGPRLNIK